MTDVAFHIAAIEIDHAVAGLMAEAKGVYYVRPRSVGGRTDSRGRRIAADGVVDGYYRTSKGKDGEAVSKINLADVSDDVLRDMYAGRSISRNMTEADSKRLEEFRGRVRAEAEKRGVSLELRPAERERRAVRAERRPRQLPVTPPPVRSQATPGVDKAQSDAAIEKLVAAQHALDRWTIARRDPSKFQPTMAAEWEKAFDKREGAFDAAVKIDPVRVAIEYPSKWRAFAYRLPKDLLADLERSNTTEDQIAVLAKYVAKLGAKRPATTETIGEFADQVLRLARAQQAGRVGRDLVLINYVWQAYQAANPKAPIDLETFKERLREAWKARKMPLAQANVLDPKMFGDVRESRIVDGRQEWHAIDLAADAAKPAASVSRDDIAEAAKIGREEFAAGKPRAPAASARYMDHLRAVGAAQPRPIGWTLPLATAYIDGWDQANVSTPVPGIGWTRTHKPSPTITLEPASRVMDRDEARIRGQFAAVASRETPYAVEKGFGASAEAAQQDALARLRDNGNRIAQHRVVDRGRADGKEHGMTVRADGSVVPTATSGRHDNLIEINDKVAPELFDGAVPDKSLSFHHNHPKNGNLSQSDIRGVLEMPKLGTLYAHGHNGSTFVASFSGRAYAPKFSEDYEVAQAVLTPTIGKLHERREIGTADANTVFGHLRSKALADAGWFTYEARGLAPSTERAIKLVEASIKPVYDRLVQNLKEPTRDVPAKPAGSVRRNSRVDRILAGTATAAGDGTGSGRASRSGNASRSGTGRGNAAAAKPARTLALAGDKDTYLRNARAFLKDVETTLTQVGFGPHPGRPGRNGKPGKPAETVRVNRAGDAVSGEVSLTMVNGSGDGVYVQINRDSSVSPVMYRRATLADPYGARAMNRWDAGRIAADEFAKRLIDLAGQPR